MTNLTKKQLKIAVEMYALADTFWGVEGVAETEEEALVQNATSQRAEKIWNRKFPNLEIPTSLCDCIKLAKEYTK